MLRMNFGDKNAIKHCRVVSDDGGRARKVSRSNDAERARVVLAGTSKYEAPSRSSFSM